MRRANTDSIAIEQTSWHNCPQDRTQQMASPKISTAVNKIQSRTLNSSLSLQGPNDSRNSCSRCHLAHLFRIAVSRNRGHKKSFSAIFLMIFRTENGILRFSPTVHLKPQSCALRTSCIYSCRRTRPSAACSNVLISYDLQLVQDGILLYLSYLTQSTERSSQDWRYLNHDALRQCHLS